MITSCAFLFPPLPWFIIYYLLFIMKKDGWKTVIQLIVSILTAALTALGTTSCMGHGPLYV